MTTATSARQDCLALPYTATTKRKANQFADALEQAFIYNIKTEIFEDGGKATAAGKNITIILNDGTPATYSAEGNYTHG